MKIESLLNNQSIVNTQRQSIDYPQVLFFIFAEA